ncbi:S8 family serine peptidase [Galactobacter sp.]|uniref:S8 family peptidase n=1 Tax=Galactobacter sp. TaxID=2676125 RepID=UPI0025C04278|nr:S8 family serine peptidase [Galactobacter sp.]
MTQRSRRWLSGVLALTAGAALTFSTLPAQAAPNAEPDDHDNTAVKASDSQLKKLKDLQNLKVNSELRTATGDVDVYVQFTGKGAYEQTQSADTLKGLSKSIKNDATTKAKTKSIRANIASKADAVAKASGAKVVYKTTNALPGVALRGDAAKLRELSKRSDVVKVSKIVPKTPTNSPTDINTGALASWTKQKQTGKGVTIAVLDTGVDYTHASFGGPGTTAAYKKAQASEKLPSKSSGLIDSTKFLGGWDLVGDDYDSNPDNPTYQPVPHPDPNPLDCQAAGHGSHVAGTAAGYGVDSNGKTFSGDYSKLTATKAKTMRVGPGSAPESRLVGIRVFGCTGSSSVVGQALDYVLDPNNDGDFTDRAQIVNMSLGSDRSPVDDPENAIVDALTEQGILSVVASGNAGDVTDVGGSPGNSRSSLTVANSIGTRAAIDTTKVSAPANVKGDYGSQLSVNYAWGTTAKSGTVVVPNGDATTTGCEPIKDSKVKGKWVWLHWTDDPTGENLPCGSGARFDAAAAAGAAGVVLDSPTEIFSAGIAGNTKVPGIQLTASGSKKLLPAAKKGTLKVTVDPKLKATYNAETHAFDTLNSSSSRGAHGQDGVSKPDVAAPGTAIGSVDVGSGNGAASKSGTSMATPHTAGIAALVAGSGNYTAYQTKALVMNTAVKDIKAGKVAYGPHRVGSGRVQADAALKNPVIAYDKDAADLVSVVFGHVEVGTDSKTVTREIELKNLSNQYRVYDAKYLASTAVPGASVKLNKSSVKVPAKGIARVKVTVTVDPTKLTKVMDPTMSKQQLGLDRQYLSELTGRVQFTATGLPTLRVPVTATPEPTSSMKVADSDISAGEADLTLGGIDLNENGYQSLVSVLTLGATSPELGEELDDVPSARQMDLTSVGANSNSPSVGLNNGVLSVGVATAEAWPNLAGANQIQVDYDVDGDGKTDYSSFTTSADDLDLSLVKTVDAQGQDVDLQPLNELMGDVDSNTFDTNVAVLPVSLKSLGVTKANASKLKYQVSTWNEYYTDDSGDSKAVDSTDWIAYNPVSPSVTVQRVGTTVPDLDDGLISVKTTEADQKLLLLHHHNPLASREEILDLQ